MHFKNVHKSVVSLLVGTATVVSIYPATLKAITATDTYVSATNTSTLAKAAPAALPTPQTTTDLRVKDASALDLWLEKLADLESHGQDHIKILDVNGKYSYGCLQFQEWTFKTFGAKYGLLKSGSNWQEEIYDCSLQKEIAKRMIRDDYSLWQSWYTSVMERDLGLPPQG